jgi:HlyD family secretion protein
MSRLSTLRQRWYVPLVACFLVFMAFNVSRLLRADTPTKPRPSDVRDAARIVPPPGAEADERMRPPPLASVSGNGVIEPATPETNVGTVVAGRIAQIAAREGEKVEAGAVLFELEAEVETAQLAAATAEVEAATAQLARSVRGSREEDVKAAVADAETAVARANAASAIAERLGRAAASGAATVDEADRARRQASVEEAAVRAAEARRQSVLAGSRREDIQLARAQLAAAAARRAEAEALRARLTIRAPIAGEILQVKYRKGEYVQPGGEQLAVMGDTSRLRVRMDVDERDIGKIRVGGAVVVRVNAFAGVDFAGTIAEIGRRMGRKNVRSDDPAERNDTKILEVLIDLQRTEGGPGGGTGLIVGQRVTAYVVPSAAR